MAVVDDSDHRMTGTLVGALLAGRYHLRSLLGQGGMAEVYLAHDGLLGRAVAVKVFRPGCGLSEDQARRQVEARLLAGLSHQGLVTVFDAGNDQGIGREFLVTELVAGPTLASRLSTGKLDETEWRAVGADLAAALTYVHSRGIVHRDVKPANVLFTGKTTAAGSGSSVKLSDFGIARYLEGARLTSEGLTVGTANYLSPEQALGADVTPASDIYSLGLVLIECATGSIVFPGSGIAAAAARLHRQPELPIGLGPDLNALFTAMTNREPGERPSAAMVTAALSRDSRGSTSGAIAAAALNREGQHGPDVTVINQAATTHSLAIGRRKSPEDEGNRAAASRSRRVPGIWITALIAAAALLMGGGLLRARIPFSKPAGGTDQSTSAPSGSPQPTLARRTPPPSAGPQSQSGPTASAASVGQRRSSTVSTSPATQVPATRPPAGGLAKSKGKGKGKGKAHP